MDDEEEEAMDAMQKLGERNNDDLTQALESVTKDIFEKGVLPKDAMGLSDSMMEGIYGHTFRLYNAGQYPEALALFRLLILLDSTEPKYVLGMAACYHMTQEYQNAATTYALVGIIDPLNPVPHYHASDCYTKMDMISSAISELEQTIQLCSNQPQYALIRDRSQMTLDALKTSLEVAKEAKEKAKR